MIYNYEGHTLNTIMVKYGFNPQRINYSLTAVSSYISKVGPNYYNEFPSNTRAKKSNDANNNLIGFIHVFDGKGYLKTKETTFNLKKDDLIFLKFKECLLLSCGNNNFDFICNWFYLENLNLEYFKVFNIKFDEEEYKNQEEIISNLSRNNYLSICKGTVSLQNMLLTLAERTENILSTKPHYEIMKKVNAYIKDNVNSVIQISDLIKISNFSKTHFLKLFKENFNMQPKQYVMKEKLEKSTYLLLNTSLPITNIAYDLSFYSPTHFTSKFKQVYKMTPTAYRKKYQKNPLDIISIETSSRTDSKS